MRASTSRAVALSSTTSARSGAAVGTGDGAAAAAGSASAGASGSVMRKRNRLPSPGTLESASSPPIRATRRWLMARPRPVPPKRRVVDASACVKALKMRAWCSAAMPMPVSRTATSSVTPSAPRSTTAIDTTTSPTLVNFIALALRLTSTCCRCIASPTRRFGTSAAMSKISSRGLSSRLADTMTDRSRSRWSRRNGCEFSVISADSIFEKSRMSLSRPSNARAAP